MMRKLVEAVLFTALIVLSCIPRHDRIEEDSPLWNCHTMGNHICGPVDPTTK